MKLDKTDVMILSILKKDARKSFREIAKELDISTPTISSKISNLDELGVIKGYHADIDTESLSESSVILLIKCSPSDLNEAAEKLKELRGGTEVFVLSSSRIFLKITLQQPTELNNMLTSLASIDPIQDYEYYSIIDAVKEEPRAVIQEELSITLKCYYCKKQMKDEPVKLKLDGKNHYVCCNTCAKHYKEKYEKLKSQV
jgi:DNA-binding Lrp family transcriptional regulator